MARGTPAPLEPLALRSEPHRARQ